MKTLVILLGIVRFVSSIVTVWGALILIAALPQPYQFPGYLLLFGLLGIWMTE